MIIFLRKLSIMRRYLYKWHSYFNFDGYKISYVGTGEVAQSLIALDALPQVLSSIPSNHLMAHSIYNGIWYCLLACLKKATANSYKKIMQSINQSWKCGQKSTSSSLCDDTFSGYRILCWQLLSGNTLGIKFCRLPASVSVVL